jgi:polyferredoxin/tetratricopeptide (TPR) repeat protein
VTPSPILKGPSGQRQAIPAGTSMGRRRALVLLVIHLAIGAHILHWLLAGSTLTPLEPSEAIAFSREGLINAGTLLLLLSVLATVVFGRFFCGWACHLLAVQDGCRWLLARVGLQPRPQHSRVLAWFPLLAFLYMFIWPLAGRLLSDTAPRGRWDLMTSSFWATFPGWTLGILTFVLCGALIVWFLGAKGFCTYACPYGAAYTAVDRFSPLRIRVNDSCAGCAVCTSVCTSGVNVSREVRQHSMVVNTGCMKTLDCVAACPNKALRLGWGLPALWRRAARVPEHRSGRLRLLEEGLLGVVAVAGFFTLRGLYGKVSFLLALGACVMVAFAALLALRLGREHHLRLQHLSLKLDGRLTGRGRVALGMVLLLGLFMAHSAWIQGQSWLAIRALDRASLAQGEESDRALAKAAGHARLAVSTGLASDHRMEILLARVAQRGRDTAQAERHYRRALAAEPRSHALQAEFGEFLVARGQQGEGWGLLEKALAGSPDLERARQGVGLRMLEQGRAREALALFLEGERRDPGDPAWPAHTGNAHAALEDVSAAEAAWNRALAIQAGYRPALRRLAELRGRQGRFAESLELVTELLRDTPQDGRLHELAARAALADGQTERARRHLDLALRFLPADPALLELGRRLPPPLP